MSNYRKFTLEPDSSGTMTRQMQEVIDKRPGAVPTPQMKEVMDKMTERPNMQWVTPRDVPKDFMMETSPPPAQATAAQEQMSVTAGIQPSHVLPNHQSRFEEKKKDGKFKVHEKLINKLQIVLKLATIQAYDVGGRIQNRHGEYIPNSNIINLITYAMSPGKILVGEEDFLNLMFKARVDPELLLNENVRAKLKYKYDNSITPQTTTASSSTSQGPEAYVERSRAYKRPYEEDPDIVADTRAKKRKIRWDIDDDDE